MEYFKTFNQFINESIVTDDERKYIAFIEQYGEDNIWEDLDKFITALESEGFSEDTINNAKEVYGTNEDTSDDKKDVEPEKISLNERIYEMYKQMYAEACNNENDEDPAHTLEGFMTECFTTMAEMCTRVMKENVEFSLVAAKAAMKKTNEKAYDEQVVYDTTHEYINSMMKSIREVYTEKMESMMEENPAIASIAAKALSKEMEGNPDANNY